MTRFKSLPFQPPLNRRNIHVFGGNGGRQDTRGFAVRPVVIIGTLIWHEFAVVRQFPFEVLIGADILKPHLCSLRYLKDRQKELKFILQSCHNCDYNRSVPFEGAPAQMRYVDRALHDSRNEYRSIMTSLRCFWLQSVRSGLSLKAR